MRARGEWARLHRESGLLRLTACRRVEDREQSAQKKLEPFETPASVRQSFIRRIYCELIKNYCLTKTKTYLEEKGY